MKRKSITKRTAERLHRAAYEYEDLASRFRAEGFSFEANSIASIASDLGHIARQLDRKLE
jgi:hypothetical protein